MAYPPWNVTFVTIRAHHESKLRPASVSKYRSATSLEMTFAYFGLPARVVYVRLGKELELERALLKTSRDGFKYA